ncbi:MAG TPA: CAP domain-containing protein [Patescibacteria group bacterium]|nr:CAP domain-containing protein [Patescibacteria group bacterium]
MKHYVVPTKENGYAPKLLHHHRLHWYGFFGVGLKIFITLVFFAVYPSQAFFSSITSDRIIQLVNEERVKASLTPLSRNGDLETAASLKAGDMLTKDYFAHYAPDGTSPWDFFRQVHYQYTYAGENLGMGFSDAESLVKAWMASPKHKKNIMNPAYREIGIAVKTGIIGKEGTTLAVQMFGTSFLSTGGVALPSPETPETSPGTEQVSGAERVVELKAGPQPWWGQLASKADQIYKLFILALIILLLLKIFIRIEIQHARIIVHAVFVIFLFGALLLLQTHFLEGTIRDQLISIL